MHVATSARKLRDDAMEYIATHPDAQRLVGHGAGLAHLQPLDDDVAVEGVAVWRDDGVRHEVQGQRTPQHLPHKRRRFHTHIQIYDPDKLGMTHTN